MRASEILVRYGRLGEPRLNTDQYNALSLALAVVALLISIGSLVWAVRNARAAERSAAAAEMSASEAQDANRTARAALGHARSARREDAIAAVLLKANELVTLFNVLRTIAVGVHGATAAASSAQHSGALATRQTMQAEFDRAKPWHAEAERLLTNVGRKELESAADDDLFKRHTEMVGQVLEVTRLRDKWQNAAEHWRSQAAANRLR